MKIELVHPVSKNYPSVGLYSDCFKISTLLGRVEHIAEVIENNRITVNFASTKENPKDAANEFRGAVFEGFGEITIKLVGMIPQWGLSNYEPIWLKDYGIDGKGIGANGKLATVQFKYIDSTTLFRFNFR